MSSYDGGDCCLIEIDCSYCIHCDCHMSGIGNDNLCQNEMLPMTCTSDKAKLMVAFGLGLENRDRMLTEVLDIENANVECDSFGDDSLTVTAHYWPSVAVGGLVSGKPIVCGPKFADSTNWNEIIFFNTCWELEDSGVWVNFQNQTKVRLKAFAIPMTNSRGQNVLWITGGEPGTSLLCDKCWRYIALNSTEFVSPTGSRQGENAVNSTTVNVDERIGPNLPYSGGVYGHCIVGSVSGNFLLIGGLDTENTVENEVLGDKEFEFTHVRLLYNTWWLDIDSQDWVQGPSLYISRYKHSCGVLIDSVDGTEIAIAAGGLSDFKKQALGQINEFSIKETELLVIKHPKKNGQWSSGPDLPQEMHDSVHVTTQDKKQFIVGEGKTHLDGVDKHVRSLYRLQCFALKCEWSRMKQELKYWRPMKAVAILLPSHNYQVNCTSTMP